MSRLIFDWAAIQRFYDDGHSYKECRLRFGFSRAAESKALTRGRFRLRTADAKERYGPGNSKYDWPAVQCYYNEGHSYRECRLKFGFCAAAWTKAVRRGALRARARQWPLHKLLALGKSRRSIKARLLEAGILQNRCDLCGLSEWRGRPLSIQIDHRNGVRDDHRLENLRMLCPNCHSQTETFGSRNRKTQSNRSRVVQR